MPEQFKLENEEFSEKYKEWWWTYSLNFKLVFNGRIIKKITITDHTWKKKGRQKITKELILTIFKEKIKEIEPEPKKNINWKRDHFVPQRIPFEGRKYKLVFWFKDDTDNHLWVKNCHEQD
jgi:hypothetical protein